MATSPEQVQSLRYTVLIEPTNEPEHPGWYYAHVPALDLTTHGEGVEGALAAARDLIGGWVAELRAAGKPVPIEDAAFVTQVEVAA
ncbi:MAG: type II toxin-antitoxin system HicB family antitoxin [Phycisphaeraceae bacterium]|nr:type II toxin-antitoxin system HicB family antitoxin [Phycisphaeraceae bacterium]